jgi:hypothetical protein
MVYGYVWSMTINICAALQPRFPLPTPRVLEEGNGGAPSHFLVLPSCAQATATTDAVLAICRTAARRLRNRSLVINITELPCGLLQVTMQIIAVGLDNSAGQLGNAIERIVEHCWRLGAVPYFHSVWRWRVTFFDIHNDTSTGHHEACYETRLRRGHESIVRDLFKGRPAPVLARIGRTICAILSSPNTGPTAIPLLLDNPIVVFYAGRTCRASEQGFSALMIARIHRETGACNVLYMRGRIFPGKMTRAPMAGQLGVLQGLRTCRRYGWGPVHSGARGGQQSRDGSTAPHEDAAAEAGPQGAILDDSEDRGRCRGGHLDGDAERTHAGGPRDPASS